MPTNLLQSKPAFDIAQIPQIVNDHYGLPCADCTVLNSERDQNFLLRTHGGEKYVFKIANGSEDTEFLQAQIEMMQRVAAAGIGPGVVPGLAENCVTIVDRDGRSFAARLVTWLDGHVLSSLPFVSRDLLKSWGRIVGQVDRALTGFDHPALHRDFYWDLANAETLVNSGTGTIANAAVRRQTGVLLQRFRRHTRPLLGELPKSVIHNDANDGNIIVSPSGDSGPSDRVSGLIDFGDAVYSWTIADLAIAIAYAWLKTDDPLATTRRVLQGYLEIQKISQPEAEVLFGLACMRSCASAVIAAQQHRMRPDDEYLLVSQSAIRQTLPRLLEIPFEFAAATIRDTADMPAVGKHDAVVRWLAHQPISPVFPVHPRTPGARPRPDEFLVLDLSVGSPLITGDPAALSEPQLTAIVNDAMQDAGALMGVGRYLEPRLLYRSGQFGSANAWSMERRTIHLGIDLFAAAGTPVVASLGGVVFKTANIDRPLDYGGLVILQHETGSAESFFSLYGHLDPKSLDGLNPGQRVEPGQMIGKLGETAVNGGWPPHLHFQIILDLLDLDLEYPGVCRESHKEIWSRFSPDPNLILRIPESCFPAEPADRSRTRSRRQKYIGSGLSLSYDQPLTLVRGWGQYLFDDGGRQFLDAYNNVPHVGHCHPHVVQAVHRQMALLNTNTRYLHDHLVELAGRIAATLPDPLHVCWFVNSASEANELALRLARAFTGARDLIVQAGAYHGHSTTLIDASPYKNQGPGGQGCPDWVHPVPVADTYRGRFRDPETAGQQYAESVRETVARLQRRDKRLCAFIAESCPSVAGQILFPAGYLPAVYEHVRAAGGVCIADDVQTGYGRLGDVFYGFELQQVIPDIVVLGKPIGNGHPLAAVITTRQIAAAFDNGMEFFSTFGGNTVSCAAGLAVLDVLEREGLQENARQVGRILLESLRDLQSHHPLMGDVRGQGLFLGVELVADQASRSAAPAAARFVANRMRETGVLVGVDGCLANVIKIRPPMCFSGADAGILIDSLHAALRQWS